MSERADVVVVGMGPGGEDLAGKLAEKGLDVIGIDHGLVGGECPYWGCIPSKMMIRAANLLAEARRIPGIAGNSSVTPDWSVVAQRIREEATDDWNDQVAVDRFVKKGGRFIRGSARFIAEDRDQCGNGAGYPADTRPVRRALLDQPSRDRNEGHPDDADDPRRRADRPGARPDVRTFRREGHRRRSRRADPGAGRAGVERAADRSVRARRDRRSNGRSGREGVDGRR